MKIKLKNGNTIRIEKLSEKIKVKQLLEYINSFYNENIFLALDKKYTYAQEKKWFEDAITEIKRKEKIHYVAIFEDKIIASVEGRKDKFRENENVCLGIAIKKEFRGLGLGTILLKLIICDVKKKFKSKNIYLSVISKNYPAKKLYEKLGFREFAVFPKWTRYKTGYLDKIFMKL